MSENASQIRPLAQNFVTLFESPDPENIYGYSPGLAQAPDGRIIGTLGVGGPGTGTLPGPKFDHGDNGWNFQGQVHTSDDHGKNWTHRTRFPFMHARPFVAGKAIPLLNNWLTRCSTGTRAC